VTRDPTLWIIARSAGLVAYGLLTATVLFGLLVASRAVRSWRPAALVDVHRTLSLLALGAVAVHGLTLLADHTVPIGLGALVVPGLAGYRTPWTGAGVATAELMLVVHLSFRLRRRFGARVWRRLHWATYAIFAGATVHGLMTGTDSGRPAAIVLYATAVGAVVALTALRAGRRRRVAAASAAERLAQRGEVAGPVDRQPGPQDAAGVAVAGDEPPASTVLQFHVELGPWVTHHLQAPSEHVRPEVRRGRVRAVPAQDRRGDRAAPAGGGGPVLESDVPSEVRPPGARDVAARVHARQRRAAARVSRHPAPGRQREVPGEQR
jgi:methionine sulfoxide reductase heme-binding subunit